MSDGNNQPLDPHLIAAAMLSANNPVRMQVDRQLAIGSPQLREQWRQLAEENDRFREALWEVDAPASLEDRLLKIPNSAPRLFSLGNYRQLTKIAAVLVLAVSVVWGFRFWQARHAMQTVSQLALDQHLNQPQLQIQSSDPETIKTALQTYVPFKVDIYKPTADLRLVGAAVCHWDAHPVIFTRWEKDGRVYSLFQFLPNHFHLPDEFLRLAFTLPQNPTGGKRFQITLWADEGTHCGWALVRENNTVY